MTTKRLPSAERTTEVRPLQGLAAQGLTEILHRLYRLTVGLGDHHAVGQAGLVGRAAGRTSVMTTPCSALTPNCSATGGVRSSTWIPNFSK